jgi:hypothetical protein
MIEAIIHLVLGLVQIALLLELLRQVGQQRQPCASDISGKHGSGVRTIPTGVTHITEGHEAKVLNASEGRGD